MSNFEERLNRAADRYQQQGYQVVVRPGRDVLPEFAKDFQVEILATRADGGVLATVKETDLEFEANPNISSYAEAIEKRPGWRYDLFILGPSSPRVTPRRSDMKDASPDEVSESLRDAERILGAGFEAQAVVAAWASLESAMRHRLRAEGRKAGWGTSTQGMLNQVLDLGGLTFGELRSLEGHLLLRDAIAHGFSPPPIEPGVVPFLVDTTRRLLEPPTP